jgi:hypothetical protein
MTVKFTISLPNDLAALVRSQPNTSGYIADAIRIRQRVDATQAALAAAGIGPIPPEVREQIEASVRELQRRRADPKWRAELDARLAAINAGKFPA